MGPWGLIKLHVGYIVDTNRSQGEGPIVGGQRRAVARAGAGRTSVGSFIHIEEKILEVWRWF